MINKKYSDFLPSLQGSEELMVQVDAVSKEMDVLKNCIETEVCGKLLKHYLSHLTLKSRTDGVQPYLRQIYSCVVVF